MKKKALLRVVFFFFLFALSTKRAVSSWNDAARMATIQSLVEHRTLAIDDTEFVDLTSDKYLYEGKSFSSKPPLLAMMATPIYAVLHTLGIAFGSQPALAYYLTTLLTVGIVSALGLGLLWYMWTEEFGVAESWADLATLVIGLGTLYLPFSTVFNSHSVSAVLLLTAFFFVLQSSKDGGAIQALVAGLALAAAGGIDPSLLVFLPIGLLLTYRQNPRQALAFILGSAPILLLAAGLNWSKSGSVLPPTLNAPLRDYAGSEFREQELSGLASHDGPADVLIYAFHSTIGNRGLFSHSPVLLFSFLGTVRFWQKRRELPYSHEYVAFWLGCLLYFVLYLLQTTNYSGEAFGIRWFVSLMLILGIPLGILEGRLRDSRRLRFGFYLVAVLSVGLSVLGSYRPFLPLADFVPGEPGIVENSILAALDRFLREASTAGQLRTLSLGVVGLASLMLAGLRWKASQTAEVSS